MAEDYVFRRAGLLERYFISRQYLGLDSCVIVGGNFYSASGERLSTKNLYPAIVHAIHRHPALTARLVGEHTRRPTFVRLPTINLEKVVFFLPDDDKRTLSEIMEDEFMDPIDPTSDETGLLLWRITVAPGDMLLFSWHHVIGDGQSGLAVLKSILDGLNLDEDVKEFDPRAVVTPARSQLVPPVEALTDVTPGIPRLLAAAVENYVPRHLTLWNVWSGNDVPDVTTDELKTHVRLLDLSPASSSKLVALSRSHRTTVTSVLYILSMSVLSELLAQRKRPGAGSTAGYSQLSTFVPVSLRPLTGSAPTVMCNELANYIAYEPLLLTGFSWDMATEFTQKLRSTLVSTREQVGSMWWLFGNYEKFFRWKICDKRENSLKLSNVGVFKPDAPRRIWNGWEEVEAPKPKWKIGKAYFAHDDAIVGAALQMNVIGSPDGSLNTCVRWGEGAIDNDVAESFVNIFQSRLDELIEKESVLGKAVS